MEKKKEIEWKRQTRPNPNPIPEAHQPNPRPGPSPVRCFPLSTPAHHLLWPSPQRSVPSTALGPAPGHLLFTATQPTRARHQPRKPAPRAPLSHGPRRGLPRSRSSPLARTARRPHSLRPKPTCRSSSSSRRASLPLDQPRRVPLLCAVDRPTSAGPPASQPVPSSF